MILLPKLAVLMQFLIFNQTRARELQVFITQKNGRPLYQAVVGLSLENKAKELLTFKSPSQTHSVVQKGQQFDPQIVAARVGDSVQFFNQDSFSHHVYSLSPNYRFQLPLFGPKDPPPSPIKMNTPGLVTVGCNIHDNMSARIMVVADDMVSLFRGSPAIFKFSRPGVYQLKVYHPNKVDSLKRPFLKRFQINNEGLKVPEPFQVIIKTDYDLSSDSDPDLDELFE